MKKNWLCIPAAGKQQAGQQEQAQKRPKSPACGSKIESLAQIVPPWPVFPSASDTSGKNPSAYSGQWDSMGCIIQIREKPAIFVQPVLRKSESEKTGCIDSETGCVLQQFNKSRKSPVSIAKSNKQWVGTCLYQEGYKPLLINCEAVIWL